MKARDPQLANSERDLVVMGFSVVRTRTGYANFDGIGGDLTVTLMRRGTETVTVRRSREASFFTVKAGNHFGTQVRS